MSLKYYLIISVLFLWFVELGTDLLLVGSLTTALSFLKIFILLIMYQVYRGEGGHSKFYIISQNETSYYKFRQIKKLNTIIN